MKVFAYLQSTPEAHRSYNRITRPLIYNDRLPCGKTLRIICIIRLRCFRTPWPWILSSKSFLRRFRGILSWLNIPPKYFYPSLFRLFILWRTFFSFLGFFLLTIWFVLFFRFLLTFGLLRVAFRFFFGLLITLRFITIVLFRRTTSLITRWRRVSSFLSLLPTLLFLRSFPL